MGKKLKKADRIKSQEKRTSDQAKYYQDRRAEANDISSELKSWTALEMKKIIERHIMRNMDDFFGDMEGGIPDLLRWGRDELDRLEFLYGDKEAVGKLYQDNELNNAIEDQLAHTDDVGAKATLRACDDYANLIHKYFHHLVGKEFADTINQPLELARARILELREIEAKLPQREIKKNREVKNPDNVLAQYHVDKCGGG